MEESKFIRQYRKSRKLVAELNAQNFRNLFNRLNFILPIYRDNRNVRRIFHSFAKNDPPPKLDIFSINYYRNYYVNDRLKIAVCSMPKSGSTYICQSLLNTPEISLEFAQLTCPTLNMDFVGRFEAEHEVDELAILFHELRRINYVTQLHVKSSRYLEETLHHYRIIPIIVYRNIFDAIVSLDDMLMARQQSDFPMFRIPKLYYSMDRHSRLEVLCTLASPWYIMFYVSWRRARRPAVWVSYEKDICNDAQRLSNIIYNGVAEFGKQVNSFSLSQAAIEKGLAAAKRSQVTRFNKGVVGRGYLVPENVQDNIRKAVSCYGDEINVDDIAEARVQSR